MSLETSAQHNPRFRVLMSGPMPPAIGGMASVIGALGESDLARQTDLALFDTGKKTREGRSLWEGVRARWDLMREWRRQLKRHHADIAHIHTCSGLTFFLDGLLLLLARQPGRRTFLHIHGARFDQFLDALNPVLLGLARILARRADTVIALSDDWRQRLQTRLPGSHVQVLANGVPEPVGKVDRGHSTPARFLFLGNLCKRKGVDVLLDAMEQARAPWLVQLAGGDEEPGFTDWTRREIERRNLHPRAQLMGPVVGPAKDQLLLQADGFVLPSRAEGLPMSLLEAMAARLPLVVTTVGAMPEVIEHGRDGLLVPPNDAAALAAALDHLAQLPRDQTTAMGQAAFDKYRSRYSVDAMAHNLLQLYAAPTSR